MVAGPKNVEQVFTLENVKQTIDAILWNHGLKPDIETLRIAQYFIESSFRLLVKVNPYSIPKALKASVEEAIDSSRFLAAQLIPIEQREYFTSEFERKEDIS